MSRGCSSGGGQSSLGYLFGSDQQKNEPPPLKPLQPPPYGVDFDSEEPPGNLPPPEKQRSSNSHLRSQSQTSGNFITDRPSTKVKSVPGGDSSLGYLFGKK